MILELWPDDLLPEAADVHLHNISYEHFKPEAQAALRLIGRAVFYRWGRDGYHAVYPSKDAADLLAIPIVLPNMESQVSEDFTRKTQ